MADTATTNMLGSVLSGALAKPPVAAQPVERTGRPLPNLYDTCPCHKGPDGYGREAYHLRRYTERDLALEIDRALTELPPGIDVDREVVERNVRHAFSRYLGLPVAYERCPYWHELQRRAIEARKAKLGTGSDDFLGSDL